MTNGSEEKTTELTRVPEILLKKRKEKERKTAEKVASIIEKRKAAKKSKKSRHVIFKRAEQYVKEYRIAERQEIRMHHLITSDFDFSVPEQPKLLFVIRIDNTRVITSKQKKILDILRLNRINSGVFIRLNKSIRIMLQLVNPYVAYGEPNLRSVRELIYKRGFAKINKKPVPISDNSIIERNLGDLGIICIEDLIHEIFTIGPNFKKANNFLWPFKLSDPNSGWIKRKFGHCNIIEKNKFGNRGEQINDLILKMN